MEEPQSLERVGPYAPPENVARVLDRVRKSGPRKLDTDFLGQLGIQVAMAPRTMRTLEFLGFTDKNGVPKQLLQDYYNSSETEARKILAATVRESYAAIWAAASPDLDDRVKIEDAFRIMEPAGQRNRMVTLFLGLCQQAGIPVKKAVPNRVTPALKRSSRTGTPLRPRIKEIQPETHSPTHEDVRVPVRKSDMLEILLDKFPAFDPSWSEDLKAAWFDGFRRLHEDASK